MEAAYFQAAIPEPYVIFGLRLLPLSIGRYRLLKRFENAFVSDEAKELGIRELFNHLVLGLVICSLKVEEFLDLLDTGALEQQLRDFVARIELEMVADPHFSLLEKYGLFQSYIRESSTVPQYWQEEESPPSGAEWSHNLEIMLRSECGYTEREIQEGPLSKALADYFKVAENRGAIRLMTQEEIEQGKANEAIFATLAGKGGACPGSN